MLSVPKGMLRLAALRLLSESSMSGAELQKSIARKSDDEWRPGPGSIYLILRDLLRKGLIVELPKRSATVRRYVITRKGREELARMSKEAEAQVAKQTRLLSLYALMASDE